MRTLFPSWIATKAGLSICSSASEEKDVGLASLGCSCIDDSLDNTHQIVSSIDVTSKTKLVGSSIRSDHIRFCMSKEFRNILKRKAIPAKHSSDGATRTMAGNRSSGIFLWNACALAKGRN